MTLNLDRSSWQKVKFADVVRNVNDTVKDPASAGIERVLGLEHLNPGDLHIRRWGEVSQESTFTRRVRPGQTLFGKRRAYQRKTAYAEFDAVCSGDILVFESAEPTRLVPELLPFITMTDAFYAMALETSAGSLSPRTRWSDIAKYEFDLPPLSQQKRIAQLLWNLDRHRCSSESLAKSCSDLREAYRSEWMDQYQGPMSRMDDVALIAAQNGLNRPKASRDGLYPMVDMGALFRGEEVRAGGYERVSLSEDEESKFALLAGDLLFARQSIVFEGAGVCCLVPELPELTVFESHVIRVRVDPRRVSGAFLAHYFRSRPGRRAMSAIVRRGPVSGVAGSDLRNLTVPVPPAGDVERFLALMGMMSSAVTSAAAEAERVGELLKATAEEVLV